MVSQEKLLKQNKNKVKESNCFKYFVDPRTFIWDLLLKTCKPRFTPLLINKNFDTG